MGAEEEHVIKQIATETGQSHEVVERVVAAIHDAIDYWLADDYVVVLAPFTLAYGDSPTRRALVAAESDPPHDALHGDHLAIAKWLGLDFDDYVLNPVANRISLVAAIADRLDSADEEIDRLWAVLEAWETTYEDPRRVYQVSAAGREAKLEEWLVEHIAALRDHGFHLIVSHRQHVLPSRRRPDLIARILSDDDEHRIGDWLVLELKATRAYPDALRQLDDYVTEVREHIATGVETVHGLLIADGINHADQDLRSDLGIAFLSLAQIGYRQHLIEHRSASPMVPSEPPRTLSPSVAEAAEESADDWTAYLPSLDPAFEDEAERVTVAKALWSMREQRRNGYEARWGGLADWPAQHPTTVVDVLRAAWTVRAAVCVRCGWHVLESRGVELHTEAKKHALANPHASVLERGENPPRQRVTRGLPARFEQARRDAHRAARRVQMRSDAEHEDTLD
ncbi:endonuclease NucS domain-containing protein [Nocardioides sp. Soil777]|uniref:endonuclease NucS domain-containing protein n=1 Tax=Nocardioides sp. Soil777 TaxID=1736409 RepID=UPI000B2BEAEF|nr:endonuclease NucS domain-containing protein [Nocardioides sp. Soil777]